MQTSNNPLLEEIQERADKLYFNEFTTRTEFLKLSEMDKKSLIAQHVLIETQSTNDVIDTLFKGKKRIDNEELSKISTKDSDYFRDIDKSVGDIKRTKYHRDTVALLNYAIETNAASPRKNKEFDQAATDILQLISYLETNASKLRTAINKEASTANSKELAASFYRTVVYMIQSTADILYASGMKADFDYTGPKPTVGSIHFEMNPIIEPMMLYIRQLNTVFRSGKVMKVFDGSLREAMDHAQKQLSLNENVLDVAFGLVTQFKFLDLVLLFPIYLVRAISYWIMYFYATGKKLYIGIDESIEMRKKAVITKDEFDAYSASANRRAFDSGQSLSKAEVTIDADSAEDKRKLNNLSGSVLI